MQTTKIDRAILSHLLVTGPRRPTATAVVPSYEGLAAAGYATRAPLGDDRFEYKITPVGRDYLARTRAIAAVPPT